MLFLRFPKKSQITVVIILGMIVFLSLLIAVYLNELYAESTLKPYIYRGTSLQSQYDSLNAYVGFCLKDAVDGKEKGDSVVLKIAKQGIAANGISSQQVLALIELLTFESNQIKLAKFAYQFTFDKQNYFLVNDGFTFSSSISELNKFLSVY